MCETKQLQYVFSFWLMFVCCRIGFDNCSLQGHIIESGYTQHMLGVLKTSRAFIAAGEAKTLGGAGKVSADIIATCRVRMQSFVALAVQTLRAEFPCFELLSSFGIFNVAPSQKTVCNQSDERTCTSIQRLAQVFSCDSEALMSEFLDHQPIARHAATQGHDNFNAWKFAVLKTRSRASSRSNHPSDALHVILVCYGAFNGCTTSGVEQMFSQIAQHVPPERNHMTHQNERAEVKLISDWDRAHPEPLLIKTQEVWSSVFGVARASAVDRLDKGVPRPRGEQEARLLQTPVVSI